MLDRIGVKVK